MLNAGQVRYKLDYKSMMFMKHHEFPYFLHKRNDSLLMSHDVNQDYFIQGAGDRQLPDQDG